MTLRTRLILTLTSIFLTIVVMSAVFVIHHGRQAVENELRSSVELALRLLDAGIAEQGGEEGGFSRWLSALTQAQGTRHLRLRVFRNEQQMFVTPSPSASETAAPGWFAHWVAPTPRWIERRFPMPDGSPIRVVIQADPTDEIAEVWEESLGFLRLLGLLAVTICAVIYVMLGRALGSIRLILRGLEGIEAGDYGARLPRFALPEFARLANTFNHMAAALEKARRENRALTQRSLAIQEEERRYIARELHDEMGQSLSAIKALTVSVRAMVAQPEGREALTTIGRLCDQLFDVVRALMRRLRPVMMEDLGLAASLEDLIGHWKTRHPNSRVVFHCEPAVEACADLVRMHVFRIVQECLTNVSRHAEASVISIRLAVIGHNAGQAIRLDFSDDGKGFDTEQPTLGFGLFGIRDRALSLGGDFSLQTQPGHGVHLSITLPDQYEENDENDAHPARG
jgi:two-component system sensor histidine kinase UhpB